MKAFDKHTLFNPSGCLYHHAFSEFIFEELSQDEARAVKLHLEECEICHHAFSGYKQILNCEQFDKINTELREKVIGEVSKKGRSPWPTPLFFRKAVAVLLPVIALSIYLLSGKVNDSGKSYEVRLLGANVVSNDTLFVYENAYIVKNDMLVGKEVLPKALQNKHLNFNNTEYPNSVTFQYGGQYHWVPSVVYNDFPSAPVKIMVRTF